MKNLVKIKETLYCSVRHYGKALLLLVALTALSGSAWAWDMVEQMDRGLNVQFWTTTEVWAFGDGGNQTGTATKALGDQDKVILDGFWTKMRRWTNSGTDYHPDVVGTTFYYSEKSDFSDSHNYYSNVTGTDTYSDNKIHKVEVSKKNIKTYDKPGNYHLYMYFCIKGRKNCTPNACDQEDCAYAYNNGNQNYQVTFTITGIGNLSKSSLSFDNTIVNRESAAKEVTYTLYGSGNTIKTATSSTADFTVVSKTTTKVTIKFTPKSTGYKTATITLTDNYGKTATISVSGTGLEQKTPTVYIGAKEVVDNTDVTLSGYVKYTGCYPITEYGFLVGTDESAVEAGTGTKYQGETAGSIAAGSDFTLTQQFADNLYYYRAWIKANGTDYYSSETRSFQIIGGCPYPTPKPTLTMDGNVNNLVCLNETSTAECRSAIGYKYYLYKDDAPAVDEHGTPFAERPGTGATFKWTGNFGAGTFTVRTKPNDQECMAVIATATQAVNEPTLAITASKNEATAFEPVTISMDDGQTGLTKPIWATTGGYLLDSGTGLIYSGKEISEVTLKAGVDAETAITVTATSYKTGEYEGVTKTCPATATKVITVSPAEEDCPKP